MRANWDIVELWHKSVESFEPSCAINPRRAIFVFEAERKTAIRIRIRRCPLQLGGRSVILSLSSPSSSLICFQLTAFILNKYNSKPSAEKKPVSNDDVIGGPSRAQISGGYIVNLNKKEREIARVFQKVSRLILKEVWLWT